MYDCERCGASFSPVRVASPEACPRCLARDGVRAPLVYSLFAELKDRREPPTSPSAAALEPSEEPGGAPSATA
jgi:FPG/IleRS zinc finger protein